MSENKDLIKSRERIDQRIDMITTPEIKIQTSALAAVLAKEYAFDPFRLGSTDPLNDFNRSLKKMISSEKVNANYQLKYFDKLIGDDPFRIFPTRDELLNELLPLLRPLHDQYPWLRTGLSISSPVGLPGTISLNIITRLYNAQKHLGIKIKISVFVDNYNRFFYEVGFVNISKSLFEFEKNFLEQPAPKGDYHILQQLVNQVKIFIRRRPVVTGMDLTPAYYHVLPLCLRLEGKAQDEKEFSDWINTLQKAADHSLNMLRKNESHFFETCKNVNRRYIISWLLSNGKLICPANNEPLSWSPPRLIWLAT